jgi:antitoxin (DNA-binding transcriptional repressor) of toxin-antitoxin stability system
MRSVSVQELEEHIPDLQAGETLTLVHGGKVLAKVVPEPAEQMESEFPKKWASEEERLAAIEDLMKALRKGYDFGDFKFNRAELYDDAI